MPLRPLPLLRKANVALTVLAILLLLFGLTFADAVWRSRTTDHTASRALVRELGLTDLGLFTEARYTRHPSQADWHTPFQDHPTALEHFPTGALLTPPPHLACRLEQAEVPSPILSILPHPDQLIGGETQRLRLVQ